MNRQSYQFTSISVTCGGVPLRSVTHVHYNATPRNPLANYWRRRAEWKACRRNRRGVNGR